MEKRESYVAHARAQFTYIELILAEIGCERARAKWLHCAPTTGELFEAKLALRGVKLPLSSQCQVAR